MMKAFLITLLIVAFAWMAYSLWVFVDYTFMWGGQNLPTKELINQIIWLVIKNVPTVLVMIFAKNRLD